VVVVGALCCVGGSRALLAMAGVLGIGFLFFFFQRLTSTIKRVEMKKKNGNGIESL